METPSNQPPECATVRQLLRGSLDTAIKDAAPNDFAAFFATHKNIRAIGFNGQKAHALFMRHFGRANATLLNEMKLMVLPSTSPAATQLFAKKAQSWRKFIQNNCAGG